MHTPSCQEQNFIQKMRRLGTMVVAGTFVLGFSIGNIFAILLYLR